MAEDLYANKITVNRIELLEKLEANLAQHTADYTEAEAGFRQAVIAAFDERLAELAAGEEVKYEHLHVSLDIPISYEREYHRAIQMLKMSKQDEVMLSVAQFTQYVLDEWSWKDAFANTAAVYGAQGSAGPRGPSGPARCLPREKARA